MNEDIDRVIRYVYNEFGREFVDSIVDLKQQLQAYKDKEDKLRKYCESNRGYVQGYGFVYREDEKLQEVKNNILQILNEGSDENEC